MDTKKKVAAPVSLKLDGKPFELNPLTPIIKRLLSELQSLPADDMFSTQMLVTKCSVSEDTLKRAAPLDALAPHTAVVRGKRFWGSAAAIAELHRQLGERA